MSYNIKLQELIISSSVEPYNLGFDCEKFDEMFSEYYTENLITNKAGKMPTLREFLSDCDLTETAEVFELFPALAGAELLFLYECSECGSTSREYCKEDECQDCLVIAKENEQLKNSIIYDKL